MNNCPRLDLRQRFAKGFSLVEAMVSLAVLTVAIMTFLMSMQTATMVSRDEMAETDVQTNSRKTFESVVADLTNARIVYLPNDFSNSNVGVPVSTMVDPIAFLQPITYSDSDAATHPIWLLMKYQVPLVNKNPANGNGPGTFDPASYEKYSYTGADSSGKPISWGAYNTGDAIGTPGACYNIVFKQIGIIDEAPFGSSLSLPTSSPYGIGVDLLNDGKASRLIVGEIERRFEIPKPGGDGFYDGHARAGGSPSFYPASIGSLEKVYPGRALMKCDIPNNSLAWHPMYAPGANPPDPQDAMFYWLEYPGLPAATNYTDGIFHSITFGSSNPVPQNPDPVSHLPNAAGYTDENFNNCWDPILCIQMRFLEGTNSSLRMVKHMTRININNQRTD